jgi:hypothetical protein
LPRLESVKLDVREIVKRPQLIGHMAPCGFVRVTNPRQFPIVGYSPGVVSFERREAFALADAEGDFWQVQGCPCPVTAQSEAV